MSLVEQFKEVIRMTLRAVKKNPLLLTPFGLVFLMVMDEKDRAEYLKRLIGDETDL